MESVLSCNLWFRKKEFEPLQSEAAFKPYLSGAKQIAQISQMMRGAALQRSGDGKVEIVDGKESMLRVDQET